MWNDVRGALRSLRRERAFAFLVVLSLALGIGANTAIFSVVNGILLRPLPYRDPDQLVSIREVVPKLTHLYPSLPVNFNHYREWRKHSTGFESLAIVHPTGLNFTGEGDPELLMGARVSANTFHVLGVSPTLGRTFLEEEEPEGRDQAAILSDGLWRRRFHADPGVVGRKITLDGKPYLIVGVMPAAFQFPRQTELGTSGLGEKIEIYKPIGYSKEDLEEIEGDYNYAVIGRLKQAVSPRQAIAELNVIQAEISSRIREKMDLHVALSSLHEDIAGGFRRGLLVLSGAVGAVLLILCVNLANLSLARATGHVRESAIRAALGAGRGQLIRQSLTESLLLAVLGGVLGGFLAWWGVRLLVAAAPVDLPLLSEVRLDGTVLGFALLISIATGLACGILPALRTASAHPHEALKSGNYTTTEGGGRMRVRDILVALEAALSALLLIAAGLLVSSFVRLTHVDKGFDVERVLAARIVLPSTKYTTNAEKSAFFERAVEKIRPLPGVLSTSTVSALPFQGETWIDLVATEGDQRPLFERPMVNVRMVTPDYFNTLRIPLREGRTFDDNQRNRKVAIISQGTAQRLWPNQSAFGRRMLHNEESVEVVGVTADIRSTSLDKDPVLMIYLPDWQRPRLSASLLVRTGMDPRGIAAGVREAIRQVDPDVPVPEMTTLQQVMAESVAQRRFQMTLVILFSAAALALAGFGIYGVVSYSVTRRRTEMGIRMALGAGAPGLQRMVLWQGLRPVVAGLAAGVLAALAAGRILNSMLFQVNARDPLTISGVVIVLLLVSMAAALLPARRATRVDPISALRFE
ncbi:MAG: ABC transporter permease [Bryobacteraceae bacterium]